MPKMTDSPIKSREPKSYVSVGNSQRADREISFIDRANWPASPLWETSNQTDLSICVNMPLSLSQIFARNFHKAVASLLQQHFQYCKLFSSLICGECQRLRHMKFLYFDQVAALMVKQNYSFGLVHCFHRAALQQLVINSGKAYD